MQFPRKIILLLPVVIGSPLFAQNLVLNPGFENTGGLSQGSYQLYYTSYPDWSDPSGGSSDIIVAYDNKKKKKHAYSYYTPDSGSVCTGIYASKNGEQWCEYLQGELSTPLVKNNIYNFSVSITISDPTYADVADFIGVSFSAEKRERLSTSEHEPIHLKPDFVMAACKVVKRQNGWKRYTYQYTAKGGESFFIFGAFNPHGGRFNDSYTDSPYCNVDEFSLTGLRPLGPIPDFVFQNDTNATMSHFTREHIHQQNAIVFLNALQEDRSDVVDRIQWWINRRTGTRGSMKPKDRR
ncbi:MAG TPA: hypothetical protein VL651_00945 [Bacteroidia bacterium]|jgi:hypothetical protein|nr:hypothetical protein [Bacteroidia bacterium]